MGRARIWTILGAVLAVGLLVAACGGGDTPKIKNARLEVGDKAPDFRLPDHTGGYIRLSDYQGQKNVVLAFYPLAWTPV
jgi:peroxiredoxin